MYSELSNGLKVIKIPSKGNTCSLMLFVKVGSRDEPKKQLGMSHLLEHLLFKRSKKRPHENQITHELDSLGAKFNAYTEKDYTVYMIKVYNKFFEKAADILSDLVFHSKITSSDFKKEKNVVKEELRNRLDDLNEYAIEIFEDNAFIGPLQNSIGGTNSSVDNISYTNLINHYEKYYIPQNSILVLSGHCPKSNEIVRKYFRIKKGKEFERRYSLCLAVPPKSKEIKVKKKVSSHRLLVGYTFNPKFQLEMELIRILLAGSPSSNLAIKVRERLGLAYFITSKVKVFQEGGYILTIVSAAKSNIPKIKKIVISESEKLSHSIPSLELKKAKSHLKGLFNVQFENTIKQGKFYGIQYIYNTKGRSLEETLKHLEKITPNQLLKITKEVFENPVIVCIGF